MPRFSTRCVENVREGSIELHIVPKVRCAKSLTVLAWQLLGEHLNDLTPIRLPTITATKFLLGNALSQQPIVLDESNVNRRPSGDLLGVDNRLRVI